ncbi:hypothetical protein HMN09_01407600 [Mycena chlorophos]|uniref:Gem-associated protein 2 n=1 Tax=Mycena chlorophos TaxID=658473 RepID=A0A8H6RUW3_MYCCL|nr:hypothetical protein HMN09_01407600 [Mycena chlorophos]
MSAFFGDEAFGKQILPVADSLPDDFDGVPRSGEEYLLTVRRDARSLPHITRVPNPYGLPERPQPTSDRDRLLAAPHAALPTQEWCALYETRFRNFRKNLSQPTTRLQTQNTGRRVMPELTLRECWWAFLTGKPIEEWDPPRKGKAKLQRGMRGFAEDDKDEQAAATDAATAPTNGSLPIYKSPEPTPSLLMRIDHRMALHLLMYFAHWANLHVEKRLRLDKPHARWVFALLARVDEQLSADEMHLLRNLARGFIAVLKALPKADAAAAAGVLVDEVDATSCWLIVATVVGVWGQRDLWSDAEAALV